MADDKDVATRQPFEARTGDSFERMIEAELATVDGDGVERRLTKAGQVRKAQLIEKAALLFAENGYEETRVVDIMRAAGVSKGLFYWYFENKEALFRELVISTRMRLRAAQAAAAGNDSDPLIRLAKAIAVSVEFVAKNFNTYRVITRTDFEGKFDGVLLDGASYYTAETARAIGDCQADGTVRDGDPVEMAVGINGAVSAFASLCAGESRPEQVLHLAHTCTDFCLRAIVASQGRFENAISALGGKTLAP